MIEKLELNEQELQANYEEFIKFISGFFKDERKEKLLHMYSENEMGLRACMAPASMAEHFHLAVPGGYLLHIMHVVKAAYGIKKIYKTMGAAINFTDEEMVFAALHHDLGKLGDDTGEYYLDQDEDWQRRKGFVYKMNPNIQYLEVTDRAVYNLQRYGIVYSWKEYLGIILADGMYNDDAAKYLKTTNVNTYLKTNLPRIIHAADYVSTVSERDTWFFEKVN